MPKKIHALTVVYNGLSNVLKSKATVGFAFDPKKTPTPAQIEFDAIWDTGASASVITQNVVNKCNLKPIGLVNVHTAGGLSQCNSYLVSLGLPNGVGFPALRVTEGQINGADVLIGMDVIASGDFAVSNFNGNTVFSYRIPSVTTTDFVLEVKQSNRLNMPKVGRNSPCPCGSGEKYKKCCGKV